MKSAARQNNGGRWILVVAMLGWVAACGRSTDTDGGETLNEHVANSDSAPAADSAAVTDIVTATDTAAAIDSVMATDTAAAIDSVTATDTAAAIDSVTATDTASAADTVLNPDTESGSAEDTSAKIPMDTGSETTTEQEPGSDVDTGPLWPDLTMDQIGPAQLIGEGYQFTEGPLWDSINQRLLFSDIDADTIYSLTLPDKVDVYRTPSGNANGLAWSRAGQLLAAEQGRRRVSITQTDSTIVTLADKYGERPLNSPNDLAVRSDGTVYFSDPVFGLADGLSDLGFMGLYRITTDGDLMLEAVFDGAPNGLAFSPDETTLYVAVTFDNEIVRFDVGVDGKLSNEQVFASVSQPDGMAVDNAGNLYIAGRNTGSGDGVSVFAADGRKIGFILLEQPPTNCAFGGPKGDILFVTATKVLYKITVPIPGL